MATVYVKRLSCIYTFHNIIQKDVMLLSTYSFIYFLFPTLFIIIVYLE